MKWHLSGPLQVGQHCFSLPVRNTFIKHVFSLVLAQWTNERNKFHEKIVKSLLQVEVNLDYNCRQMHEVISKNKQLMEKIVSGKKDSTK